MLHGAVPVNATDKLVEVPEQIEAVPLIIAVGNGLTVTTALPVKEVAVQLISLAAVKVYVLEAEGVTVITRGLVVIPVMVTGVVPSV
jgi:hypothetical protein